MAWRASDSASRRRPVRYSRSERKQYPRADPSFEPLPARIHERGLHRGLRHLAGVGKDEAGDGVPVRRRLGAHLGQQPVVSERPPGAGDRLVGRGGDRVRLAGHGGQRETLAERAARQAGVAEPACASSAPGRSSGCTRPALMRSASSSRDSSRSVSPSRPRSARGPPRPPARDRRGATTRRARARSGPARVGRRAERRPKVLLSSRLVLRHLGRPRRRSTPARCHSAGGSASARSRYARASSGRRRPARRLRPHIGRRRAARHHWDRRPGGEWRSPRSARPPRRAAAPLAHARRFAYATESSCERPAR